MKLTDRTRFPYPVLWTATNDYADPDDLFGFEVEPTLEELTSSPTISFALALKSEYLSKLLSAGRLGIGVSIVCKSTYFDRVFDVNLGPSTLSFEPMSLSGDVRIRPVAWLTEDLPNQPIQGAASEYVGLNFSLGTGALLAVGEETVVYVGREKSTPLASIFHLENASELAPHEYLVDLEGEYVSIRAGDSAHATIAGLRNGDLAARTILLSSVYLSALQATLSELTGPDQSTHEGKRWYAVIMARLAAMGIASENIEPLKHAQALLRFPLKQLGSTVLNPND